MTHTLVVDVGEIPVLLRTDDASLIPIIERRFSRFLNPAARPAFEFEAISASRTASDPDGDVDVRCDNGIWTMRRGDFLATWDVAEGRGRIALIPSPYAVDSILRIVHTLILAREGGFLLHASSAVRNGRAFVFTGPSGAGKSTIVGLAPKDVTVMTDEVSYVRRTEDGYVAFGTPFAGELADVGEPVRAPVAALFRLGRGDENQHVPMRRSDSVRTLMRNILFFANDRTLVSGVFDAAAEFADRVPAYELRFIPDATVWSTIQ